MKHLPILNLVTSNGVALHAPKWWFFTRKKKRGLEEVPSSSSPAAKPQRTGLFRKILPIVVILSTVGVLGGGYYYQSTHSGLPLADQITGDYLSNKQLEAQYGLRIELVAVTFGGGVIDFRYRIVDPKKAAPLLHEEANMPILTTLDQGLKLYPSRMMMRHHQSIKKNYVPYRFFPNARGAVKPGTAVTVSFGNIRVGPIIAQ